MSGTDINGKSRDEEALCISWVKHNDVQNHPFRTVENFNDDFLFFFLHQVLFALMQMDLW